MPSDFPTLSLECGREVFADEIHIGGTYAGLLEGVPHDELNQSFLASLPEQMQSTFGGAPVYVLPPEIERRAEPHPMGGSRQIALSRDGFQTSAAAFNGLRVELYADGTTAVAPEQKQTLFAHWNSK